MSDIDRLKEQLINWIALATKRMDEIKSLTAERDQLRKALVDCVCMLETLQIADARAEAERMEEER